MSNVSSILSEAITLAGQPATATNKKAMQALLMELQATSTHHGELKIGCSVPWPNKDATPMPFSNITFSLYNVDGAAEIDEAKVLAALLAFRRVIQAFYLTVKEESKHIKATGGDERIKRTPAPADDEEIPS